MTIRICTAPTLQARVRYIHCPTCERRRRFFAEDNGWYGWTVTCLTCGDAWSDGERMLRPFAPRWRERSVARAKERMRLAKAAGVPRRATNAQLAEYYGVESDEVGGEWHDTLKEL